MSWNVSMVINTGVDDAEVYEVGNYTYNVAPMYYHVLGDDGLRGLNGKLGEDACPLLMAAVTKMELDEAALREMNPENGWGDYEGALVFLRKIATGCAMHPKASVRIS